MGKRKATRKRNKIDSSSNEGRESPGKQQQHETTRTVFSVLSINDALTTRLKPALLCRLLVLGNDELAKRKRLVVVASADVNDDAIFNRIGKKSDAKHG